MVELRQVQAQSIEHRGDEYDDQTKQGVLWKSTRGLLAITVTMRFKLERQSRRKKVLRIRLHSQ